MSKKISLLVLASGSVLEEDLPDGKYALLTYDYGHIKTFRGTSLGNVMPWSIAIYESDSGLCIPITSSSIPDKPLTEHDVLKVFAVGLKHEQIEEFKKKMESRGISFS